MSPTRRAAMGAALLLVVCVAVAFPFVNGDAAGQVGEVLVDAVAVVGLNVAAGYTGLLAIGVGALVGIGAYATALLDVDTGMPAAFALVCGTVLATALGMVVLAPSLRLGRAAFAMVSLFTAYAFAGAAAITPLQHLIHADTEGGLVNITALVPLRVAGDSQETVTYFIALIVLVVAVAGCRRLVLSHWGRALRAVRDDEVGASSAGVDPLRARLLALLVCAFCASLSGALYAVTSQGCVDTCSLSVGRFSLTFSIFLVSALVVGGPGSVVGPVLGALAVGWYFVVEAGATSGTDVAGRLVAGGAVYGVVLLIAAAWLRGGVVGSARSLLTRRPQGHDSASGTGGTALSGWHGEVSAPLNVTDVDAAFGGVRALTGVSLTCTPGSVHAVIGANGSGKTTLLNVISGFVTPASGGVAIGERDLAGMAPHQRARAGVGRTFQTPRVAESASVLENVMTGAFERYPSGLHGLYLRPLNHRANELRLREEAHLLLRAVGIDGFADAPARVLSHGRRRLLEVARSLMAHPAVILLDEPAAGLSDLELDELAGVLAATRDSGCAVVLVEHNLGFVRRVATTATALDAGCVLADGPVESVLAQDEVVARFMGGRVA